VKKPTKQQTYSLKAFPDKFEVQFQFNLFDDSLKIDCFESRKKERKEQNEGKSVSNQTHQAVSNQSNTTQLKPNHVVISDSIENVKRRKECF